MSNLYFKALELGATDFGESKRKNKRFYVLYNGHYIHFGSKNGSAFIDHHDEIKRKNWRARHSKIINKDNVPFYKIKESPEFWSWNLLW
jgi:hypothetical protein